MLKLIHIAALLTCFSFCATDAPFKVKESLFDQSNPNTLGLTTRSGTEHAVIYQPREGDNFYNHGAVLFPFEGKLYAQWQSSKQDEDAPDTHILYAISEDGLTWSAPYQLTQPSNQYFTTSGGWWQFDGTLIAFINRWAHQTDGLKTGQTWFRLSKDGIHWDEAKTLLDAHQQPIQGVIEQDLRALPSGRIVTAFHVAPGLTATPYFTDLPSALAGWKSGKMPHLAFDPTKRTSREIEPSWYQKSNGEVVMVFRDQASSYHKLASLSRDNGESWSQPVLTNMPDARTKQSAGNLPDGTAFLVGNPVMNKSRFPLVVTLSQNGEFFDQAALVRSKQSLPAQRKEGKYKRAGFSYPKSLVWNGYLYIVYASNKEDIELTRIPLSSLSSNSQQQPISPTQQ